MAVAIARKSTDGDDPRAELKRAIAARAAAQDRLDRRHEAVGRARTLARDAQTAAETAHAAVEEAREQDALVLASSISTGDSESSPHALRRAREREVEARDGAEAAQNALAALRAGTDDMTAEAERATKAVDTAVTAVLLPVAQTLLAEARDHRM